MSITEREQVEVTEREQRARDFEAAALELELRGWCQNTLEDIAGRVCMIGALSKVVPVPRWGARELTESSRLPAEFNDAPGRTAAEVAFVLRWRAQEIRDGL